MLLLLATLKVQADFMMEEEFSPSPASTSEKSDTPVPKKTERSRCPDSYMANARMTSCVLYQPS